MRPVLVPLALTAAVVAFAAPAGAAPGNCVAVAPARPTCSVQSAGGDFRVDCIVAVDFCYAEVDGWGYYLDSAEGMGWWVPYGTVIWVGVAGIGVATVTTTN